ncbi:MAG: c-type cytochrome domain-containing protein, partial [Verrucomicrobiales bacterium]
MDPIPRFTFLALVSGFVTTSGIVAAGDSLSSEQIAFFESNIRPVLVEKCFKCHSQSSEKIKGGLILDTRESTLKGGDSGAAVTPGSLDESLLYTAITYQDADLQMPPKSKLPDEIVATFKEWIEMGAPDPRTGDIKIAASPAMNLEKGRQHWAYQAPVAQPPPAVGDAAWAKTDLDRFILAKLEAAGMRPSGDANARDVLRRLSFDLIGLPPTPS